MAVGTAPPLMSKTYPLMLAVDCGIGDCGEGDSNLGRRAGRSRLVTRSNIAVLSAVHEGAGIVGRGPGKGRTRRDRGRFRTGGSLRCSRNDSHLETPLPMVFVSIRCMADLAPFGPEASILSRRDV